MCFFIGLPQWIQWAAWYSVDKGLTFKTMHELWNESDKVHILAPPPFSLVDTPLSLSFLICSMGIMTPTGILRIQWEKESSVSFSVLPSFLLNVEWKENSCFLLTGIESLGSQAKNYFEVSESFLRIFASAALDRVRSTFLFGLIYSSSPLHYRS